jgi:hypothetical protein
LARVVFPLLIAIVEIVRLLLWCFQAAIDTLLIETTTKCFLYPKSELDDTSHDA